MNVRTKLWVTAVGAIIALHLLSRLLAGEPSPSKVQIPDRDYLARLSQDMARPDASTSQAARDRLSAYARDTTKPDLSRTLAIDFIGSAVLFAGAAKSYDTMKVLASLLADESPSVRTRAFYGLPLEIRSKIPNYDYTASQVPKEFEPKLREAYRLIEVYVLEQKRNKA